jgi:hypothetical protein
MNLKILLFNEFFSDVSDHHLLLKEVNPEASLLTLIAFSDIFPSLFF